MPTLTSEEARLALADIEKTGKRMKQAMAADAFGYYLIVWGLVWVAGFGGTFLRPDRAGILWTVLVSLGILATATLGIASQRRPKIRSSNHRAEGRQITLFWTAILVYAYTLAWMLPLRGEMAPVVVLVSVIMLGYVIMGLWARSLLLSLIGLGVTAATLLGWHLLQPLPFMLWMAIFGGGGLLIPGAVIQLRWRAAKP